MGWRRQQLLATARFGCVLVHRGNRGRQPAPAHWFCYGLTSAGVLPEARTDIRTGSSVT